MTPVLLGKDLVLNGETAPKKERTNKYNKYVPGTEKKHGLKNRKETIQTWVFPAKHRPVIIPFKKTPMENSLQNPINDMTS